MSKVFDPINWDSPKFLEENRTFETRLIFLNEIFSNTFDQDDILGRCIQHKLHIQIEQIEEDTRRAMWNLSGVDPLKILKYID